jgi:hypothetical protein
MVWNLTADEVVKHWDLIKYGVYQVRKPPQPERYFIGILKEIFSNKVQVWFLADAERNIKAMALTRLTSNIAGINELEVNELYGYSPMTLAEQQEGYNAFIKFARNLGLSAIIASTAYPQVAELMKRVKMTKLHETYKLRIEGEA